MHVAIIMDGNGRWATQRGLPRTAGHVEGAKAVRATVESAARAGVDTLTLYAFSAANWSQIWVPPGFAHGFCVTSESALFAYKCTELYHPEHELGIAWDDADIGITWPVEEPVLSGKDRAYPRLAAVPESRLPPLVP